MSDAFFWEAFKAVQIGIISLAMAYPEREGQDIQGNRTGGLSVALGRGAILAVSVWG